MKLFSNNDAFFFTRTHPQLDQMAKIHQKLDFFCANWRDHSYACNSLTNFPYKTHAMTGNGNQSAKTWLEKLVKSLQVNLILAGLSLLWYAVSSYASVVAASLLETPAAISSALYRSSSHLVCRPAETLFVCMYLICKRGPFEIWISGWASSR